MSASGTAHAEVIIGGQIGSLKHESTFQTSGVVTTDGVETPGVKVSADFDFTQYGGFLQVRDGMVGLHAGISTTSLDGLGAVADLLGMFVVKGNALNAMFLFGASSFQYTDVEVEYEANPVPGGPGFTTYTVSSKDATGWKAGVGIEIPVDSLSIQFTYEYADFGKSDSGTEFVQSGVFLRMGYHF